MNKEERLNFLEDVKKFCEKLKPLQEKAYIKYRFNDHLIPLAKEFNLLGMPVKKEYNGREADFLSYFNALRMIQSIGVGSRTFFSAHSSISQTPIQQFGSEYIKEKYLKPSAKGDMILAFALTEVEAGSDPYSMKLTYEKSGDSYILDSGEFIEEYGMPKGSKYLIGNAGIADAAVVFACEKGSDRDNKRKISAFIVDIKKNKINKDNNIGSKDFGKDGIAAGTIFNKGGMYDANVGFLSFRNFQLPKKNLLGTESAGFKIAMNTLMSGRLSVAAGCVGTIDDCLIEASSYAKKRIQHGEPIARKQLIQEHFATMKTNRDAAWSLVCAAVKAKEEYEQVPEDRNLRRTADTIIAEAKFFASNSAYDSADRAVQIFGGRGFLTECRALRHFHDVRVCRIYEGTDEILKLKIASDVLGSEFEAYK